MQFAFSYFPGRSVNCLDLKNPYFRYTGQATGPPPGLNTVSPSEAYWSQLDAQVRQISEGGAQAATFDMSQWPTNGGQIQITNALNNTVNMVNGISLNGYNDVLEVPAPAAAATSHCSAATGTAATASTAASNQQSCSKTRQRIGSMVPTSTCAAQLIGGGVTPSVFSNQSTSQQQQQQVVAANSSPFVAAGGADPLSNFVANSADLMVSHE